MKVWHWDCQDNFSEGEFLLRWPIWIKSKQSTYDCRAHVEYYKIMFFPSSTILGWLPNKKKVKRFHLTCSHITFPLHEYSPIHFYGHPHSRWQACISHFHAISSKLTVQSLTLFSFNWAYVYSWPFKTLCLEIRKWIVYDVLPPYLAHNIIRLKA